MGYTIAIFYFSLYQIELFLMCVYLHCVSTNWDLPMSHRSTIDRHCHTYLCLCYFDTTKSWDTLHSSCAAALRIYIEYIYIIFFQLYYQFSLACFCSVLSPKFVHTTKQCFKITACCWLYLLYPSQPGVAGGLQVVQGSRPASFSRFLSNNGFNSGWLWMQGHSWLDGACFQGAAGPPLFLYYHKQIRGSGEHTQMQIAAERPISTLHYNGPSCMCRLSQPIKHKMNLM